MSSLQDVALDYNPFKSWSIPDSLCDASALKSFSATNASVSGRIPDFLGGDAFAGLTSLHLSYNFLEGELPNSFSGSSIQSLWLNSFSIRDNSFTGPVPASLISLSSLRSVNLTNNLLQGPTPNFDQSLLTYVVESMGYPKLFAENWKGNDPCSSSNWLGITCSNKNITVINLQKLGLNGTISPKFAEIKSLQRLLLANNKKKQKKKKRGCRLFRV